MRSVLVFLTAFLCPSLFAAERPNILIVLTDDQGWGDLSIHGNTNLSTPNVDSLARDGALFERFYVCPVCSPTRAEFLTGRYHPRGGIWDTSVGGERLNLDEKTIADTFKAAGYATGCFGKWHNGSQYPYHPNGRGFDEYYGFTSGHWGDYFDPPLQHNGKLVKGKGFIIDDLTDHALEFIDKNKDRPFFCYVPFNTPHSPMQVPDRFWTKFKDKPLALRAGNPQQENENHTRAALAMCENIDWNVGRLLRMLADRKLAEDTIVVYFCDNGPNGWRWNGGMKGRKGSTDEGGVRSPLLVRWPGHIRPGSKGPDIVAAIDLLPTLAGLAGVKVVSEKPLDGSNFAPHLLGKPYEPYDRMIFSHWKGRVSVRTRQFRLDENGQLFDMIADPGQTKDVSGERPAEAKKLREAVEVWRKNVLAELPKKDERPFPAGYREFPITVLPARDGVPHGGIVRSSRSAPNCSFFTHWTSKDDHITWDVNVATAGRYAVTVNYTCPPADVGSEIEMSFNGRTLAGRVSEAHDPPLRGAEHDRVKRAGESYVKDFKALNMGTLELPAGRGLLTLRATKVPGKQVMDLRSVVVTLEK